MRRRLGVPEGDILAAIDLLASISVPTVVISFENASHAELLAQAAEPLAVYMPPAGSPPHARLPVRGPHEHRPHAARPMPLRRRAEHRLPQRTRRRGAVHLGRCTRVSRTAHQEGRPRWLRRVPRTHGAL